MAKVNFSGETVSWRGRVGNGVFRELNGEVILQSRPHRPNRKRRRKGTPKQEARRMLTRMAGKYGRDASRHPDLRPIYEAIAEAENQGVGSMANRDAFRAPRIDRIDTSSYGGTPGDEIAIAATDDTGVVLVHVRLTYEDGRRIERGHAEQAADGWWIYTATSSVPEGAFVSIEVLARDRPYGRAYAGAGFVVTRVDSAATRPVRAMIPYGGGHPALWKTEEDAPIPDTAITPKSNRAFAAAAHGDTPAVRDLLDPAIIVREARKRAGLNQKDLAARAGMSQSVVSRIEQGKTSPSVATLIQLVRAAGFELVGGLAVSPTSA